MSDKDNTSDRGSGSHEGVLVILTWDEAAVRRAFIRRVFALLTVMLLIVSGMGSVTIFSQVVRDYLSEKWWISLIAWIPFLIVYFVLICFAGARRSFPCNFILLMILTVSMGVVVMTNCARADPTYVVLVFLVSTLCCLGIIIFAYMFRVDTWLFILFALFLACILYAAAAVVITHYYPPKNILPVILCAFGCILFMGFLAFDARSIIQGRQRGVRVQPDEVVLGALVLFLDIVYLFLCMLGIGGGDN